MKGLGVLEGVLPAKGKPVYLVMASMVDLDQVPTVPRALVEDKFPSVLEAGRNWVGRNWVGELTPPPFFQGLTECLSRGAQTDWISPLTSIHQRQRGTTLGKWISAVRTNPSLYGFSTDNPKLDDVLSNSLSELASHICLTQTALCLLANDTETTFSQCLPQRVVLGLSLKMKSTPLTLKKYFNETNGWRTGGRDTFKCVIRDNYHRLFSGLQAGKVTHPSLPASGMGPSGLARDVDNDIRSVEHEVVLELLSNHDYGFQAVFVQTPPRFNLADLVKKYNTKIGVHLHNEAPTKIAIALAERCHTSAVLCFVNEVCDFLQGYLTGTWLLNENQMMEQVPAGTESGGMVLFSNWDNQDIYLNRTTQVLYKTRASLERTLSKSSLIGHRRTKPTPPPDTNSGSSSSSSHHSVSPSSQPRASPSPPKTVSFNGSVSETPPPPAPSTCTPPPPSSLPPSPSPPSPPPQAIHSTASITVSPPPASGSLVSVLVSDTSPSSASPSLRPLSPPAELGLISPTTLQSSPASSDVLFSQVSERRDRQHAKHNAQYSRGVEEEEEAAAVKESELTIIEAVAPITDVHKNSILSPIMGRLVVTVVNASLMASNKQQGGKNIVSPYVELQLGGDVIRHTVIEKRTLQPVWQETFAIPIPLSVSSGGSLYTPVVSLDVRCMDGSYGLHPATVVSRSTGVGTSPQQHQQGAIVECLGTGTVPLNNLTRGHVVNRTVDLITVDNYNIGSLNLELKALNFGRLLTGFVPDNEGEDNRPTAMSNTPCQTDVNQQADTHSQTEVHRQTDTPCQTEINQQTDTHAQTEINRQTDTPSQTETNLQTHTHVQTEAHQQHDAPSQTELNRQTDTHSQTDPKAPPQTDHTNTHCQTDQNNSTNIHCQTDPNIGVPLPTIKISSPNMNAGTHKTNESTNNITKSTGTTIPPTAVTTGNSNNSSSSGGGSSSSSSALPTTLSNGLSTIENGVGKLRVGVDSANVESTLSQDVYVKLAVNDGEGKSYTTSSKPKQKKTVVWHENVEMDVPVVRNAPTTPNHINTVNTYNLQNEILEPSALIPIIEITRCYEELVISLHDSNTDAVIGQNRVRLDKAVRGVTVPCMLQMDGITENTTTDGGAHNIPTSITITLNAMDFGTDPTHNVGLLKVSVESANLKTKCPWKAHTTPDGLQYYHNKETNITQWNKPDEFLLPSAHVRLQVLPSGKCHTTSTKQVTKHPCWNETFDFHVNTLDSICSEDLGVEVYDGGTLLGSTRLPLHTLQRGETTIRKVKLSDHAADVVLVLTAFDFGIVLKPLGASPTSMKAVNNASPERAREHVPVPQEYQSPPNSKAMESPRHQHYHQHQSSRRTNSENTTPERPCWDYSTIFSSPKRLYRVSGVGEHLPFLLSPSNQHSTNSSILGTSQTSNNPNTSNNNTNDTTTTTSNNSGPTVNGGNSNAFSGFDKVFYTTSLNRNATPRSSSIPCQFSPTYPNVTSEYPSVGYDYGGRTTPPDLPVSPRQCTSVANTQSKLLTSGQTRQTPPSNPITAYTYNPPVNTNNTASSITPKSPPMHAHGATHTDLHSPRSPRSYKTQTSSTPIKSSGSRSPSVKSPASPRTPRRTDSPLSSPRGAFKSPSSRPKQQPPKQTASPATQKRAMARK